jgi:hypothetical protein
MAHRPSRGKPLDKIVNLIAMVYDALNQLQGKRKGFGW